ncbi:MAG: Zn-ribbon domain-containing OB-fold protein [Nitrososphaerales archaeon]
MQEFIESLNAGRLVTSKCLECKNIIWPPSNVCPTCVSDRIEWVGIDANGKLVELSESFLTNEPSVFGLVELDNGIRLMAKIVGSNAKLKKGNNVKMTKCGLEKNEVYFEFQLI